MMGAQLAIKAIGKIGQGRKAANEIVKSQNALQAAVEEILRDASLSATNKSKIVGNLFDSFQANSGAFAAGGGANAKVSNQAFSTLLPWISNIQSGLAREMALESPSGAAAGPQTVNNYNINIMVPEGKNARATGALFRDEMIPILIDAIKNNTGGLTAAVTVSVKNSLAGAVTTA